MKKIALLDYGAGNLHSLLKALGGAGRTEVVTDIAEAIRADMVVLPGVGGFGPAASGIAPQRLELRAALSDGLPCIGVCLGMQLLFESSEEGAGEGIGLIEGTVRRLNAKRLPQIGWNTIEWPDSGDSGVGILGASRLDFAYFANSFVGNPTDETTIVAWTTHEADRFPSVVRKANTVGIQFHPEKSSRAGVNFLREVVEELIACR
jgi:imidazole glycerol-phosphate synthase subunit HisH